MPNFDTVLLNKQNLCKSKYDIWVFQHKIPPWWMKAKAAFYFLILCPQLLSLERYRRKNVSKLRSIAELREYYGNVLNRIQTREVLKIIFLWIVMQDGLILVPGNRRLFTVIEEDDFQYPHTKVRHRFNIY